MLLSKLKTSVAILAAVTVLVACDSVEERIEKHFESGQALLSSGDYERAMVEFRNVLALDEFNREARRAFADAAREQGMITEAYSNYLRLAEEDPDDLVSRLALAELAIMGQNWSEAERHGAALAASETKVEGSEIVELLLRFRTALQDRDIATIEAMTAEAENLRPTHSDNPLLLRVLIEGNTQMGNLDRALEILDEAIEAEPQNMIYYASKAQILANEERLTELEDHLRLMVLRFPDHDDTKIALVRLLTSTGQQERAEAFFREQIEAGTSPLQTHVGLVSFLRQTRGDEAALAEIDAALPLYEDNRILRGLRAGILFDRGDHEEAIALMESILADSEASDETNRFKITLSRMLNVDGNEVGARKLVEEVLADDPGQVQALKIKARWQIRNDEIDEAIAGLRRAIDQAPQDYEAMTLMAQAHERAGDRELAQDLLSLAAEASGFAPEQSLNFVRVLLADDRFRPAENVLISALRESPDDLRLLERLGDVYLRTEDWGRLSQVEATLRRIDTEASRRLADRMRLQMMSRREGRDQALAMLREMAEAEGASTSARVRLLEANLAAGDSEAALAIAEEIAAENPDAPRAQFLLGNTRLATRDYEGAIETLRGVVDASPDFTLAWMQLMRAQSANGDRDAALASVDEALEKNPASSDILWAKASFLEQANDIDGAIAIYEDLYADNSSQIVIANNLASLLVTYRDDEASLERAFTIARRLRGTEIPPFQDTYGWLQYRRGEYEDAVRYLEPAASALAGDPIVQYHLGAAYAALERNRDALEQFEKALEIAGSDDPRPQMIRAAEEVERLKQIVASE